MKLFLSGACFTAIFAMTSILWTHQAYSADPKIKINYYTESDPCLAGRVQASSDGEAPILRLSPREDSKILATLKIGHILPLCEDTSPWWGVIFKPDDNDEDDLGLEGCDAYRELKPGEETGEYFEYEGPCLSGWVHKRFFESIAG